MATTSPDNIYSPDSDNQYALVQDLGAMADSVQDALESRANVYKGTTAQRISFLSTATPGMLWQDTDGIGMLWKRGASQWVPAVWRWGGTTAQMNGFTQAPEGFEWYNTTTGTEHLRLGGSWVNQETDWLPLTPLHPRFTVGDYAEYRIHAGFFSLRFRNITVSASGTYDLFNVGEVGYNPDKTVHAPVAIDGTTTPNPAWVNPSGMLRSNWMTGQSYWMEHTFKL